MRTITIGRSSECDIAIEHEHISRKHAMLKLYPMGKIEIIDMGRNGTSVNGVRIQPGVARQVRRNDVVTFAGAKTLDWSLVPNEGKILRWGIIVACIIAIVILGVLTIVNLNKDNTKNGAVEEFGGTSSSPSSTVPGGSDTEKKDEGWFKWPDFLKPTTPKKKPVKQPEKKAPENNPDNSNAGKQSGDETPAKTIPEKSNAPTKKTPAASKPAQVIM